MIRLRGGNFVHSDKEFATTEEKMDNFKTVGGCSFIFEILTKRPSDRVDRERYLRLISLACGILCTFHRAIDKVSNLGYTTREITKMALLL
jgi:copper homeostasis protein